jgi:hypothetical protein
MVESHLVVTSEKLWERSAVVLSLYDGPSEWYWMEIDLVVKLVEKDLDET